MAEHTAGPWEINYRRGQAMIVPCAPRPARGVSFVVAHVGTNVISDAAIARRDANAHLISAAPDLLTLAILFRDAIKWEIANSRREGDDEGARLKTITLNLVGQAIAKAEGRAS